MTLLPCPECGVPAEVPDRISLPSTDGPIDHLAMSCVAGHHFNLASDRLPSQSQQELAQIGHCSRERAKMPAVAARHSPEFRDRDTR